MALNISDMFTQTDVRETVTTTDVGPVLWDLDYAWSNGELGVAGVTTYGICMSGDGYKFYVCNSNGNVYQYNMSIAWDISSGTLANTLAVGGVPEDIFIRPDGLKMYIVDNTGATIDEYNLSTAWDLSTAVFLQDFSVAGSDADPIGLFFREDGKKCFICGDVNNTIYTFNLSTAWNITTASGSTSFAIGATPRSVHFNRAGDKMFVGKQGVGVVSYVLSKVYDISTAVQDTVGPGHLEGLWFKPNGSVMYNAGGSSVQQYNIKRGWR